MTRSLKTVLAAASCLFVLGASASAQDLTPPSITFDSPANGVDLATITDDPDFFSRRGRLTVTGSAIEDTRLKYVLYRLEGSKRWRKATVIRGIGDDSTNNVWSFTVTVKRRSDRRVYVRAVDFANNESDIIGRKLIRRR